MSRRRTTTQPASALAEGEHPVKWVEAHWVPLLVGVAVGYFVAKSGGVKGAGSRVKGTVGGAVA